MFSVRLPCQVLPRSLRSWILCYDIELEPQRLNSNCSLLLICIENKAEFAQISNVMLWSRAVGPVIKGPENKRIWTRHPANTSRQFQAVFSFLFDFNMPYLLDCVLGEALWSILTHWVIEDPGFRGTTAFVGWNSTTIIRIYLPNTLLSTTLFLERAIVPGYAQLLWLSSYQQE